jgi:hypothetical protein
LYMTPRAAECISELRNPCRNQIMYSN